MLKDTFEMEGLILNKLTKRKFEGKMFAFLKQRKISGFEDFTMYLL